MEIYRLKPLSICATYGYIVWGKNKNAVLIDAPDNAEYILSELESRGLTLKKILLTHGHFDHVGAVADLAEKTGCEVYIHENDLDKLSGIGDNLSDSFGGNKVKAYDKAISVKDGDKITLDEMEFTVMHTPGHTKGSVCYIADDIMFSGDTLFARSIGRTDMPDGNTPEMLKSLTKIISIEKNIKIYTGHTESTTLDIEKQYNPYLKGCMR
ncbi:MAG: MBL fold metallo-hydrolase [Oscillospiraceae bacterium]